MYLSLSNQKRNLKTKATAGPTKNQIANINQNLYLQCLPVAHY